MRKFTNLLSGFVFISQLAFAQGKKRDITEFITASYLQPKVDELKGGGIGLTGGLLYGITDKFSFGIAAEGSLSYFNLTTAEGGGSLNAWYGGRAVGEYYLTEKKVKPFIGAGIGGLKTGSFAESSLNFSADETTRITLGPRAGILFGNFRISMEYSIIPQKISSITNDYNLRFIGFHLGTHFGSSWK